MTSVKITFKKIIVAGNSINTIHFAEGYKKDGSYVKFKVMAYFEMK